MTEQNKAKRRLTGFNFAKEGAHVALVHKDQGGAASGWKEAIITKATNDITDEFVEKATMVQVTLPFDDFLEKFFGVWSEDADMLTEILGFSDEEDMNESEKGDMSWEDYKAYCEEERQAFIDSVQIMKSVKNGDIKLSDLNAKSALSVKLTQSIFEEHLSEIEKATNTSKEKKVQIEQELAKAKEDISAKEVALQKALADFNAVKQELEVIKAAQAKAKDEARITALKEVVSDEEVEALFKSTAALDDAAFSIIYKSLKAKQDAEAEAFKEKGVAAADGKAEDEDPVARIIKAKFVEQK